MHSGDVVNADEVLTATYARQSQTPEALFTQIYQELRRVARAYMRRERADHTLQATALVHEAYIRLFKGQPFQWENRQHLFCSVSKSMRRILMDHARRHAAERHGGKLQKLAFDEHGPAIFRDPVEFLALAEALDRLAQLNPRQSQVVELHYFAGLTAEEAAAVLGVSLKTLRNDWRFAKAWLKTEMRGARA